MCRKLDVALVKNVVSVKFGSDVSSISQVSQLFLLYQQYYLVSQVFTEHLLCAENCLRIQGEIWCSPPCSPGREEDVCLCDNWCECAMLTEQAETTSGGGLRPWLTRMFLPMCLSSLHLNLFLNAHQFCGEKGLLFVGVILKSTVSKRKCHIGPQKTGWLPEFWFQHTYV